MPHPPKPFFPFEQKYLVRIEALDSQHKQLVDLMNELHGSIIANMLRDSRLELLTRLITLFKTHLATEEQVLRVHRYPGYLPHKAAHEGFVRASTEFREQIATRGLELTVEHIELLMLWMIDHFTEFDQGYARFLGHKNHPIEKDSNAGRDH
jgi:hemerythrin